MNRKQKIDFLIKLKSGQATLEEISQEHKTLLWIIEFQIWICRDETVNWDLPEKQAIYNAAVKKVQTERLKGIFSTGQIFLTDHSKLSDFQ